MKIDSRIEGIEGVDISLLHPGDIDDIVEMLKNPEVCRYLFFAPAPERVYRDYFAPIAKNMKDELAEGRHPHNMVFILRDSETGEFIGQCGVMAVPLVDGVYEVGYQFREEHWGRGLATSACMLALSYIFTYLKGHRAQADTYETNMASRRVLEKCGFRQEGYFRGYFKKGDALISRANYGILRDEMGEKEILSLKKKYRVK